MLFRPSPCSPLLPYPHSHEHQVHQFPIQRLNINSFEFITSRSNNTNILENSHTIPMSLVVTSDTPCPTASTVTTYVFPHLRGFWMVLNKENFPFFQFPRFLHHPDPEYLTEESIARAPSAAIAIRQERGASIPPWSHLDPCMCVFTFQRT